MTHIIQMKYYYRLHRTQFVISACISMCVFFVCLNVFPYQLQEFVVFVEMLTLQLVAVEFFIVSNL